MHAQTHQLHRTQSIYLYVISASGSKKKSTLRQKTLSVTAMRKCRRSNLNWIERTRFVYDTNGMPVFFFADISCVGICARVWVCMCVGCCMLGYLVSVYMCWMQVFYARVRSLLFVFQSLSKFIACVCVCICMRTLYIHMYLFGVWFSDSSICLTHLRTLIHPWLLLTGRFLTCFRCCCCCLRISLWLSVFVYMRAPASYLCECMEWMYMYVCCWLTIAPISWWNRMTMLAETYPTFYLRLRSACAVFQYMESNSMSVFYRIDTDTCTQTHTHTYTHTHTHTKYKPTFFSLSAAVRLPVCVCRCASSHSCYRIRTDERITYIRYTLDLPVATQPIALHLLTSDHLRICTLCARHTIDDIGYGSALHLIVCVCCSSRRSSSQWSLEYNVPAQKLCARARLCVCLCVCSYVNVDAYVSCAEPCA